jgi:predicted SAM-dependent methyltransferase
VSSFAKVQTMVGNLIRNRQYQLRNKRIQDLRYLDLGCGPNIHEEFINIDFLWRPGVDVCWDISCSIPFRNTSIKGIFTEHCLEHFSRPAAIAILRECRRILAPGGILRIVVPDGEAYLRAYCQQLDGDPGARFPYQDHENFEGLRSPILSVNRVFYQDRDSPAGHRFIYDFHVLNLLLRHCGFSSISKRSFRTGADSSLLIDSESRRGVALRRGVGFVSVLRRAFLSCPAQRSRKSPTYLSDAGGSYLSDEDHFCAGHSINLYIR